MAEAQMGECKHMAVRRRNSLRYGGFRLWELRDYEVYVRKEDNVDSRTKESLTMAAALKALKNQNELFGAAYGREHIDERNGAV